MKLRKTLTVAAAVLGTAVSGHAQSTEIDITGSTAGRAAVSASILSILSNDTYVASGSNVNNATFALYRGTLGATPVTITTSWSGSAAGVRDVAQGNAVWVINNSAFANGALNNGTVSNLGNGAGNNTAGLVQAVPEIAYSDVFQSSTIYTAPVLSDDFAGIIPFKFYASVDAPAGLVNLWPNVAQKLWGTGYVPLALLTGSTLAADKTTYAFATGRDPESGTRITCMAEIGYGVFNNVQQYQPTIVSGAVTALTLWPAGTYVEGNGGYSSGSSVKTAVSANAFGNSKGLISYLGSSDWVASPGVAKELTYNGVSYSADNVIEGKYTFWGYLHQMKQTSLSGTPLTFYNSLLTAVQSDTSWLVKNSQMQVQRTADGGLISPKY
jgi:hypothetical protein